MGLEIQSQGDRVGRGVILPVQEEGRTVSGSYVMSGITFFELSFKIRM